MARYASSRFAAGPASAVRAMPHFGFLKLRGSVETGFAQPTPANTMHSVPSRSKCLSGLSESRPSRLAVSSPSSQAASAWPGLVERDGHQSGHHVYG